MQKLSDYPWHILLFAVFPILSLLAHNTGQVEYAAANRSLVLSIIFSALMWLVATWILKDWKKAGVLVTGINILFFSYGHIFTYLKGTEIAGVLVGRHQVFAALWLGLFFGLFLWIRRRNEFQVLTGSLNFVTALLLIFPLYTLMSFWYSNLNVHETKLSEDRSTSNLEASADSPDVYFFILDQYARSDVLAQYFNYDNSAFISGLKDLGFFIASCSQSNYPYTTASLAGTLNFNYIPALGEEF